MDMMAWEACGFFFLGMDMKKVDIVLVLSSDERNSITFSPFPMIAHFLLLV
jgi:hypothetical protein